MKKLIPLVLILIGVGAGVGAGIFLRPEPEIVEAQPEETIETEPTKPDAGPDLTREYVKMSNQFVIPIVSASAVKGLAVLSLSLEVPAGQKDAIYSHEPKLRDSFLQVLFDHANIGGFDGAFTNANNLAVLRGALRESAQKVMGDQITDVLIIEIARQDY